MIKHINKDEIDILKKRLKFIIGVKKLIAEPKAIKNKGMFKELIKEREVIPNNEIDNFIDKGNTVIINSVTSRTINEKKQKLSEILGIKKVLNNNNLENFKKGILTFEDSVNIFLDIVSTPLIEVENIVEIFSSYLNKSNLLDEDTLEKFYNCTFDYNRDYSDEEYEKKEEEYIDNESMSDFEYFIEHISEKIGFEIKSADFSDIVFYFDDVDYEFKELHESNRELFEEYKDYQDPASAFFESYGECATVYLFQDFKLSERLVDIVNFKIPVSYNGGLQTEIFTRGNNTYLTISDSFYYEPINREFLATLLCSLIKGGKYNVN